MFSVVLALAILMSLLMAGAWALQRATGSSGWIDTVWAATVGFGGIFAVVFAGGDGWRRGAVLFLVVVWSLRLAGHIGMRTRGGGEDPRYAKLIEQWGSAAALRLFLFLQIQAIAAFVLVLAVYLAASNTHVFPRMVDVIAMVVALGALAGEALSDAQLSQFRKTAAAKNSVCETGLWRYSRHPNYFFEWLFWCGFPLLAIQGQPLSWVSLAAPAMMYWLLVHVSGIPPLEDHMLQSRGEKFRALQQRVNAFFPGPRKNEDRP
ncbi:DUF1295 domain-containing protein [Agrobacterium tumefaciens]|uniref:Membrane protein n=1 Tax=Agrobacterium tumefaciens TaxID=358 RepID=A0A2L2LEE8_AGRTU|nr:MULTISPECIES: DUF1295 domain-containing protein [Agrobacterium]MBS0259651.1 DUF1295 domain-containing protein [Pseudomonadota bacterium]AVH42709.1 membrane protein [Agrobacterium tumefaciens]NSY96612.1 DUF1295 domain-containing protein [Agrobacterium tumefaciens]NSY99957.1 DUF1295 domain-containing protein [Agrobacterium tumefaciens]NSZ36257.1 DUF1295 domain-containing protein [Agrobacterium tumefaciens]